MQVERESFGKMAAYLLREGGLLLGIFGWLDGADQGLHWQWYLGVTAVSGLLLAGGMLWEAKRRV